MCIPKHVQSLRTFTGPPRVDSRQQSSPSVYVCASLVASKRERINELDRRDPAEPGARTRRRNGLTAGSHSSCKETPSFPTLPEQLFSAAPRVILRG